MYVGRSLFFKTTLLRSDRVVHQAGILLYLNPFSFIINRGYKR
jgi:hypothetical protein